MTLIFALCLFNDAFPATLTIMSGISTVALITISFDSSNFVKCLKLDDGLMGVANMN